MMMMMMLLFVAETAPSSLATYASVPRTRSTNAVAEKKEEKWHFRAFRDSLAAAPASKLAYVHNRQAQH
jgi:uncharacterized lipoprotein NlpE involved in copper resistance